MALDWDAELLGPVMAVFGEGSTDDPSSFPTYYPVACGRLTLTDAVFDAQYKRVDDLGSGMEESTSKPVLGVRDSAFAAFPGEPQQGAAVRIPSNGITYRVTNVEPDGHGHTLLILMETGLGQR